MQKAGSLESSDSSYLSISEDVIPAMEEFNNKIELGTNASLFIISVLLCGTIIGCSTVLPAESIVPGITTPYLEFTAELLMVLGATQFIHMRTIQMRSILDRMKTELTECNE